MDAWTGHQRALRLGDAGGVVEPAGDQFQVTARTGEGACRAVKVTAADIDRSVLADDPTRYVVEVLLQAKADILLGLEAAVEIVHTQGVEAEGIVLAEHEAVVAVVECAAGAEKRTDLFSAL